MAKLFDTSEEFLELIDRKYVETGLEQMGIKLMVLSTSKQKEILKIGKTSAATAYKTKDDLQLFVYEEALERLPKDMQERLIETCLSNVWYDSEKDRLMVETNPFVQIFNMRKKYSNIVDDIEASFLVIKQIEDEEKERKAAERENKKQKRNQQ